MSFPLTKLPMTGTSHDRIDFRAIFHLALEKAWLIALCFLLAAAGTATYLLRSPKVYAARCVLQVEQEEAKILNIQRVQQEELQSLESLKTVEQTLQNSALLGRVLDVHKLANDPRFAVLSDQAPPSRETLIRRLSAMVEVRLRKGTRLIDIKVEHTNPALAELVANSIVHEFLRNNHEHNSSAAEGATVFLSKEATELKRKLEASEHSLQAFKEQMQISSLDERNQVVLEKLKELGTRVTEAKSQRIVAETAWKQVTALSNDVSALLVVPAVANDSSVNETRSSIARLESELANLRQRYKELHPKLIQTQSQLAEWKSNLERAVRSVPQRIRSGYESASAAEQALEQALREQETVALDLNKLSVRYNVLARDVESDRTLYQSVLNRIKETSVTKDLKPSNIRVVQEATVPERPVKPERNRTILAGFVAALATSIFLIFLLDACDRSLKTVDQTEEYLALPVLGTVPKFSGTSGDQRKLLDGDDAECAEAESFRTLRTALSMLGRKEDRRISLFTSAVPSEGKTFCSLNYAISLAQQGLRTLIIDCDLRRPMVEKSLLKSRAGNPGLTDLLTGHKQFSEVTHPTHVENLRFLPAGTDSPNPAELLARCGITAVLDEALRHFDRVVVDSAPIHAVSDTLLILERIQTLCLVVRAGKTAKNSVRRAAQKLQEAGAPLAGVILNLVPRSHVGGYYYYDSYHDYAYRGDYGQKKAKAA